MQLICTLYLFKLCEEIFGVEIDEERRKELEIAHRSGKNGNRITVAFSSRRPGSVYMELLRKSRNREKLPEGKR